MDLLLSGLKWNTCLVYLNNMIIYGCTFEEHLFQLKELFERFREAELKLKLSKCSFCQTQVHFLGCIVSIYTKGITTDPSIRPMQLQVGLLQHAVKMYRSFLVLQTIIDVLYLDLQPSSSLYINWLKRQPSLSGHFSGNWEQAFKELKQHLTSAPTLTLPDFSKQFVLDTDATNVGIGGIFLSVL